MGQATSEQPGTVQVRGWAADYREPEKPLTVVIEVDGKKEATWVAAQPRADVAAARPGLGAKHGYSGKVSVPKKTVTVCASASSGSETKALGCKKVDAS